jgi:hypothetical protein
VAGSGCQQDPYLLLLTVELLLTAELRTLTLTQSYSQQPASLTTHWAQETLHC